MAFLKHPPTIPLSDIQWSECGDDIDPKARLLAHIRIGSLDMHLEAWEVERDEFGDQIAPERTLRSSELESLQTMMDTGFCTIEIGGREYVLVATPYGD